MPPSDEQTPAPPSRRGLIRTGGGVLAALAATSGAAQAECTVGPAPHTKGPAVFLDYDRVELDAAYDQAAYAPNMRQLLKRWVSNSDLTRERLGAPKRFAYGKTEIEALDVFPTKHPNAPIFIMLHGGAWRAVRASDMAFVAELFVNAGAHCVVPDFTTVQDAGGSLLPMADQVRRAIAWVHANANRFGGDRSRIYVGGQSSGGHLAAVALTTDWLKDFGLPADSIKGGLCISGMYDLSPVRLSQRSAYVKFDDAMVEALSPMRHLGALHAPLIVSHGTDETPEFQRQARDFAAAVKAAGKPVESIVAENYGHFDLPETLMSPYGILGRAALRMMKL
jgi:arylformamidase